MIMRNFSVMIFLLVLAACTSNQEKGCPPPPEDFTEADLIGVWQTLLPVSNDTIVFRENGTYKQIIHEDLPQVFDYESEWQPGQLFFTENFYEKPIRKFGVSIRAPCEHVLDTQDNNFNFLKWQCHNISTSNHTYSVTKAQN